MYGVCYVCLECIYVMLCVYVTYVCMRCMHVMFCMYVWYAMYECYVLLMCVCYVLCICSATYAPTVMVCMCDMYVGYLCINVTYACYVV